MAGQHSNPIKKTTPKNFRLGLVAKKKKTIVEMKMFQESPQNYYVDQKPKQVLSEWEIRQIYIFPV